MTTTTTELLGCDPDAIERAADLLRAGQLVAFPTETVYGLGANALSPEAVAQIFAAKRRPRFDPLIVHVGSIDRAAELAAPGTFAPRSAARRAVERWWPGPLTVVVRSAEEVPAIVRSGLPTVALRLPDHPVARSLLERSGVPIAAPSANRFGELSPTRACHVQRGLDGEIAAIVDGGPTTVGVESTIVAFEEDAPPQLLRHGGISRERLLELLPELVDGVRVTERPLSPGQLARHYAPRTELRLHERVDALVPSADRALLLVARGDEAPAGYGTVVRIGAGAGARPGGEQAKVQAAAELFDALHRLDDGGWSGVDVLLCDESGLGGAIRDRLTRAAATTSTDGVESSLS